MRGFHGLELFYRFGRGGLRQFVREKEIPSVAVAYVFDIVFFADIAHVIEEDYFHGFL